MTTAGELDDDDVDDVTAEEDWEPRPPRRGVDDGAAWDPRHRQVAHAAAATVGAKPAWWVGLRPGTFYVAADFVAEQLRKDPRAARVKTPTNVVGGVV